MIGLSYDDFCRLEWQEFRAVCKAFQQQREADDKAEWERMRLLATITIQPHVKKKLTAQRLLPFPWDKKSRTKGRKPVSKAEDMERFKALVERLNEQTTKE